MPGQIFVGNNSPIAKRIGRAYPADIGKPVVPDGWVLRVQAKRIDDEMNIRRIEDEIVHVEQNAAIARTGLGGKAGNPFIVKRVATEHEHIAAVQNTSHAL